MFVYCIYLRSLHQWGTAFSKTAGSLQSVGNTRSESGPSWQMLRIVSVRFQLPGICASSPIRGHITKCICAGTDEVAKTSGTDKMFQLSSPSAFAHWLFCAGNRSLSSVCMSGTILIAFTKTKHGPLQKVLVYMACRQKAVNADLLKDLSFQAVSESMLYLLSCQVNYTWAVVDVLQIFLKGREPVWPTSEELILQRFQVITVLKKLCVLLVLR